MDKINKINLLISNWEYKIVSLLNHIRNKGITHIIVTNGNKKIKCYESLELYSDEMKIIVAKCLINLKEYIITINDDNINYVLENYDEDIWNQICNISNVNTEEESEDRSIYG